MNISNFFYSQEFDTIATEYDIAFIDHPELVPQDLVFRRWDVPFSLFSERYSSPGWLIRKVSALPLALIKMSLLIVHIVEGIFSTIFSIFVPRTIVTEIKRFGFTFVRDLEEVCGWLSTIAWGRGGAFLVQEANLHKTYYSLFLNIKPQLDFQSVN